MRASVNGNPGNLIIDDCQILRYIENGKVRKFYQQFLVRFDPDSGHMKRTWWSVSNWGAGAEAPWTNGGDLKGQLKHVMQSGETHAKDANDAQVNSKLNRGYLHYTQFGGGASLDPPPKLLAEIQATALMAKTPSIKVKLGKPVPAFTRPATRVDKSDLLDSPSTDLQLVLASLQTEVNDYAEVIMNALGDGDIPRAISHRHSLLNLLGAVNALQDNANGQLEVVNAKLAAALS